jgi:stage II sporulation protein D
MDIEEYLQGVLAGEMRNDWPLEALKAQAILARTFALQFLTEKPSSMFDKNSDISTDVRESQAYKPAEINDLIKQAVEETKGMALAYDGKFIKAWFHSCAGGKTATATEGLNYKDGDLPYIQSVDSDEADAVETAKEWSNTFTESELLAALKTVGVKLDDVKSVEIGDKGPSGRAINFVVNGQKVNCPDLRVALDATKFRSTLITDIKYANSKLTMSGKGFGHGVGMSQWGAYTMAKKGSTAEDIITHYFKDVSIVKAWD